MKKLIFLFFFIAVPLIANAQDDDVYPPSKNENSRTGNS